MSCFELIEAAETLAALPRPTDADREAARRWYASALGRFAQKRRLELEMSVATAAELSGIELSEWYALEAGWVPEDRMILVSVAGTLSVRWTDLSLLAFFSQAAHTRS